MNWIILAKKHGLDKNRFGVDNRAGIRNGVGPFQLELEKENMLGCIERGSPKPKKRSPYQRKTNNNENEQYPSLL